MAPLPDPADQLAGEDKAVFDRMASGRAHAEGRAGLVEVYLRMFNNPVLARSVGALGEQLRFHGTLPDDVRELAILRFATHQGSGYEWSHHQRPAELAGVSAEALAERAAGHIPAGSAGYVRSRTGGGRCGAARTSIPSEVQDRIVAAYGHAGVVELVILCGLYATMSYMVFAFDIPIEDGLPTPPDSLR